MADFTPPQRKKNALDNNKLKLSTPCPTAPGKNSSLVWGVYSNNPRLTVYTGDPEDSGERNGYGAIKANLDGPVFYTFLEICKKIIAGPPDKKLKIDLLNFTFFGGKRSEAPVVTQEVWVGKDNDGSVWISVIAPNRPKIKFVFSNNTSYNLYHGDGTPLSKEEMSNLFALGYVNMLSNLTANVMVEEYADIVPKQQNGGGYQGRGNGGGNGGYNNNSNYNKGAPQGSSGDIPF